MTATPMTIGRLARTASVPAKTIRYYEEIGLLPAPPRRASGYRMYDGGYVSRLGFIARAKRLGLSLAEIGGILRIRDRGACPCEHVKGLLRERVERIDAAVAELGRLRTELVRLTRAKRRDQVGVCSIIEHTDLGSPAAVEAASSRPLTFRSSGRSTLMAGPRGGAK